MPKQRANILTIGGFDPSGGAGILADIKTFEQHKLLGMAVNTANTVQTEDRFVAVNWLSEELVLKQLDTLCSQYKFDFVKIGLIPNFELIHKVSERLPKAKLIWDPVLCASAGFDMNHDLSSFEKALKKIYFVTPNWNEIKILTGNDDALKGAKSIAKLCNVYLKGGHNSDDPGRDFIFAGEKEFTLRPKGSKVTEKHGSGCILSSALASNLASGYPIHKACLRTKTYTTKVLESNTTLLGYHS